MNITKVFAAKQASNMENRNPTVVFFGDSVTQGCFELYTDEGGGYNAVYDRDSAYPKYFGELLAAIYPKVPVNIINAGIGGDNAPHAAKRLERDVLCHKPDLTVVCFGLNDSGGGMEGIAKYAEALRDIITRLTESGSEVILMTPNMMNTRISGFCEARFVEIAEETMQRQVSGVFDAYVDTAKAIAAECGAKVCDVYAKWKKLAAAGVDTTMLLSNYINHPTRELNKLFASSLIDCIFEM